MRVFIFCNSIFLQILMNALMAIIHVMTMLPAPTLMEVMTVNVSLVSLGLASTAQVL